MGGGKSGGQQVTDFYMSLHLGLCAGPVDAITGIYIDQKTAWEGAVAANEDIAISKPYLFGGPQGGGGLDGIVHFMNGNDTQTLPDTLAKKLGAPNGASAPGFRGFASLFFHGSSNPGFRWTSNNPVIAQNVDVRVLRIPKGLDQSLAQVPAATDEGFIAGIGTTTYEAATHAANSINASSQYFKATASGSTVTITEVVTGNSWINSVAPVADSNYPYRASVVNGESGGHATYEYFYEITAFSGNQATLNITNTPQTGMTFSIGPETYTFSSYSGDDANPAHIIYETLTNTDWGIGVPDTLIDLDSFSICAAGLYYEQLGLSIIWTQQTSIEDFVNEVLTHINGMLFINPQTGLLTLKLLRSDYAEATLPLFTPDNAVMTNFQRKTWGETVNEIVVTWTNPVTEQAETVTVQDVGNIAVQGGIISDSRNYYGVRNEPLAMKLGARELRTASAPLCSMEMTVDRSAWDRLPGDVVTVNWPENNLFYVVMRIGKIDYGSIDDPGVKVSLTQDVFSLDAPTTTSGQGSLWQNPSEVLPEDMPFVQITTTPYFFSTTNVIGGNATLTYPEVEPTVLAYDPNRSISGFDLYTQFTNAAGVTSWNTVGTMTVAGRDVSPALSAQATTTLPVATFTHADRAPVVGGFILIGSGDTEQEIALVTASDGTNYTLARGCLDTVPQAWSAGTPLWALNPGLNNVDTYTLPSAGESIGYKLTPRSSGGVLSIDDASQHNYTLTERPYLPTRPANVKVNGTGFGSVAIGSDTNIAITWATRNRTMEQGQAVLWTDGSIAPEYHQETVVTVYDQSGNQVYQQGSLWTETSLTLPKSYFDRYTSIKIVVSSRLNDTFMSLQGHAITVTGLPGNGSAAVPPAPPAATSPPSPISAPTTGNWVVSGGTVTSGNGDSAPAITITGTPDASSDTVLLVRYKKVTDTTWLLAAPVALTGGAVAHRITSVAPATAYNVQLAYEADYNGGLIASAWMTPSASPVTTGTFIAGDTVSVGGTPAATIAAAAAASQNTVIPWLTNVSVGIKAYADGSTDSFASATGTFYLYYAGVPVAPSLISFSASASSGLTGTINSSGVYSVSTMSVDNGTLTLTATYNGKSYTQYFSVAKIRGGYEIVSALPTTNLFNGRMVYLTTDSKLYTYVTGTGWKVPGGTVNAADISGTLADAQIAALSASKITGQMVDAQIAALSSAKLTGQITSTQITDNAITTAKLAANSVTASQIAAGTITASQIAAGTITSNEIAAASIYGNKIAAYTIQGNNIAAATITAGNIASNTITASQIAANTITAGQLAADSVTASQIQAGAVTAAKLSVTSLSAISATIGTLRTATSGARTEISDNLITVYDAAGVLRVRIGVW